MYYFMKCGDTNKNIPFEIVKRYKHHVRMRSLQYPSYYGISRPYYESANPMDLNKPKSKEEVIRWVENSKDFKDVQRGVATNIPWAINIMNEWNRIKSSMS